MMKFARISAITAFGLLAAGCVSHGDSDEPKAPSTHEASVQDVTVSEGDSGHQAVEIAVALSPVPNEEITISYTLSDDSATPGDDYADAGDGTITFAAEQATAMITVNVMGDEVVEGDETFTVTLDTARLSNGEAAQGVVTIEDNDIAVNLSVEDARVTEADDRDAIIPITFNLSDAAEKEITVTFSISDGSAKSGTDYRIPSSLQAVFEAGQSEAEVLLQIIPDLIDEVDETIRIKIDSVSAPNAAITDGNAIITIVDNDPLPTVSFELLSQTLDEATGRVSAVIIMEGLSSQTVTVPVDISGTATFGDDYRMVDGNSVDIAPGQPETEIEIDLIADVIPEGGETIVMKIGNPINATRGDQDAHTMIISGDTSLNDTGYVHFSDSVNNDLTVEPASHPEQDGSLGRDVSTPAGEPMGFRFTKLDHDGNPVLPSAASWRCVRDEVTGLVWERKSFHTSLPQPSCSADPDEPCPLVSTQWQSNNFVYTFYSDDDETNGGTRGTERPGEMHSTANPQQAACGYLPNPPIDRTHSAECSSDRYIKEVNLLNVCGFTNWELPSSEQLRSIVNYDHGEPTHDPAYFDNTRFDGNYMTRTTAPTGLGTVMCLNIPTKTFRQCLKNQVDMNIRLVSSKED